jgi:hypothetical protein
MGRKVKCLQCFNIIESTYRHDFKTCSCKNISIDGGNDYFRMLFRTNDYVILPDVQAAHIFEIEGSEDEKTCCSSNNADRDGGCSG